MMNEDRNLQTRKSLRRKFQAISVTKGVGVKVVNRLVQDAQEGGSLVKHR